MLRINRHDAEQEIIQVWRSLPETMRRTEAHATVFAMKIKDDFPFRYRTRGRFETVRDIVIRYQNLIGNPLS